MTGLDPEEPTDPQRCTHTINCLDDCGTDAGQWLDAATTFVVADRESHSNNANDSPWFENNAARLIAGIGLAIMKHSGHACFADIRHVLEWPPRILSEFLSNYEVPFLPNLLGFLISGSHNAETIFATARNSLRLFIDERIAATTSKSEISLKQIVRGQKILILEIQPEDAGFLRPQTNLIFTTFLRQACQLARSFPGGRFAHGLRFHLDDFAANIGRIPQLAGTLNMMRGRNFGIAASVQTLGQIHALYRDESQPVIAGFASKIFQSPVDLADAKFASELSGMTTIQLTEYSESIEPDNEFEKRNITQTRRPIARSLYLPEEIRNAPVHFAYGRAATCFMAGFPAFQAWFRPAYQIPEYAGLFIKSRKRTHGILRRTPAIWRPAVELDEVTELRNGLTNTVGWSLLKIQERLEIVKKKIDWENTPELAQEWWIAFQKENEKNLKLVLRLAEELAIRKATIQDFFSAFRHSKTNHIHANLHFMDYTRLKKSEEKKKRDNKK